MAGPATLAGSGFGGSIHWHTPHYSGESENIRVLEACLLGAPGMHRKSGHQVGFVEKLVLRAKGEVAMLAVQTDVEACGVRDTEMGDLMGDFEVESLLGQGLGSN